MNSRSYEAYVIPAFYIQLVKIKAKLVISTNYVIQKKRKSRFSYRINSTADPHLEIQN